MRGSEVRGPTSIIVSDVTAKSDFSAAGNSWGRIGAVELPAGVRYADCVVSMGSPDVESFFPLKTYLMGA